MKNTYDIVVIGAGISGLTFANELACKGKKVLVVEEKATIGGCLHTHYHTDKTAWVELGAHTFYNKYIGLIGVLERLGLQNDIVAREKIPMRIFTNKMHKIFSKVDKMELFLSCWQLFTLSKKDKDVKQYYGKIVGKNNYKRVFHRLFNAVAVQYADKFSAEYFLKSRKIRNKNYPKSFLLKKGMSSFIQALADNENITIRTNFKVEKCVKTDGYFEIQNQNNETITAKDICFAATAAVNGALLKDINEELSRLLLNFPIQKIESKAVFMQKDKAKIEPMTFAIPLHGKCFSMVTRDIFPHSTHRGFSFHFEQDTTTKQQFVDVVLGADNQEIEQGSSALHQIPRLNVGHDNRMQQIKKLAQATGIYLVGNYFNGLSLEDCVERALEEAKRF